MDGFYLLVDLGLPLGMTGWPNETQLLNFKLPRSDIRIHSAYIWDRSRLPRRTLIPKGHGHHSLHDSGRFAFWLKGAHRDDKYAQKIADACWSILAVLNEVRLPFQESPSAMWLPRTLLRNDLIMRRSDILDLERNKPPSERIGESWLIERMGRALFLPFHIIDQMWRILPSVLETPSLFDACHFYQASIREFCFLGDSIGEVIEDTLRSPISRFDSTRSENAILNAFKAVEAIIGDPSKNESKFREKLLHEGFDPNESCGFGRKSERKSLAEQIRNMNRLRDKKAGHGKTGADRTITYFEIMEAQWCSNFILLKQLEKQRKRTRPLIKPTWLVK